MIFDAKVRSLEESTKYSLIFGKFTQTRAFSFYIILKQSTNTRHFRIIFSNNSFCINFR